MKSTAGATCTGLSECMTPENQIQGAITQASGRDEISNSAVKLCVAIRIYSFCIGDQSGIGDECTGGDNSEG
jgi:hypothetical protein